WLGAPSPLPPTVGPLRVGLGAVLFGLGFVVTVLAQLHMGDAWRIGVQDGGRTELRTTGSFAWCRNPIFTGMLLAALGMVAWIPLAAPAWLALWLGLELQVRVVEEPHLSRIHGARYQAYAARTGRFLPGVGRGVARDGSPARAARTPPALPTAPRARRRAPATRPRRRHTDPAT